MYKNNPVSLALKRGNNILYNNKLIEIYILKKGILHPFVNIRTNDISTILHIL